MRKILFENVDSLKQILCYSSAPQAIAVTEDMVDYLVRDANEVRLLMATGQSLGTIVDCLSIDNTVKGANPKIIILVRTIEGHPLAVSELSHISNLIDQFPKDTNICWGMATSKEQENNIYLLIAISTK